jgi:hypothetical protein
MTGVRTAEFPWLFGEAGEFDGSHASAAAGAAAATTAEMEAAAAAAEMAAAAAAATKTDTQRKSMSKTQTKAKAKVKVKVKLKTKATAKLQVTTIFRMLKPSRRGGPASAAVARRGHLHRWVRWIIADLAIPLLRSHFYCTETESHRLRVFYYRKGVWVRRCRLNR